MLSVVTMQAVEPWNALGQADERNFNVVGCMGSAAAVGLGLALARPAERVLVLDGDGSVLMQLGTLVSIAGLGPANLYHVVFENCVYETSGRQPLPGSGVSDLCEVAQASGFRHVYRFDSPDGLDDRLAECVRQPGPVFVSLGITGQGTVEHPVAVPNKPTQVENMRRALSAASG
jgi:phosphonopyruvate decarboxylase